MKLTTKSTKIACYAGYVVQAIVNNLIPLLFAAFSDEFGISLGRLAIIVSINFCTQIIADLASAYLLKKFGYRRICVAAHVFSTVGLVALAILPFVFSDAFWGIAISSFTMAIGGGILEVAISPLIEAVPSDNKEKEMSLLHSFYCWGHVGVVLVSTGFIWLFGIQNWRYLPLFWTILPILNSFLFHKVQLWDICPEEKGLSLKELFKMPIFYVFVALMICSGASEQAVGQWSSFFAEKGLGLSKTTADVLGTCAFAVCMGSSRLIYSLFSEKIPLKIAIFASSLLCAACFLTLGLTSSKALSVVACALTGFSVGIMWPGVYSLAAASVKNGGTSMFSLLALGGDVGCALGPIIVGEIADNSKYAIGSAPWFQELALREGILSASAFPILLATVILVLTIIGAKTNKHNR